MRKLFSANPLATLLIAITITITSFIVFYACQKVEHSDPSTGNAATIREQFFRMSPTVHPGVQAIAASIKRQDQQRNFVPGLPSKAGYPVWNKAIIVNKSSSNSQPNSKGGGGGGGETGEIILIPFVKGGEYVTNAVLLVSKDLATRDTTFKLVYARHYEEYGFNYSDTSVAGAKHIFQLFTGFDNELFGYTEFLVKDRRILSGRLDDTVGVSTQKAKIIDGYGTGYQNRMAVTICNTFWICKNECTAKTTNQPGPGCFCGYYATTICSTIYFGGEGGGIGGGGGGGGGGGSSCGWESTNPCRIAPPVGDPCSGGGDPCTGGGSGGGWEPVDPVGTEGVDHFSTWNVDVEDNLKIKSWLTNNIDTSGMDSCRKAILRKLIGKINNSPIGVLLTKLDKAIGEPSTLDKFKINFKTRPLPGKNATTEYVSYDSATKEFEADIVLDSATALNATELFIASNLIHELVHAYLAYIAKKIRSGLNVPLNSLGHGEVFNDYIDTFRTRNPALYGAILQEPEQHNYMADKLLEFMAELLAAFDNHNIANDRYYWYMSWGGLVRPHVKTWKQHWPNHPVWPPTNPAPSGDSTRGLKYALTLSRIDSIYNVVLTNEEHALPGALGRKPVPGGCY